MRCQSRFQAASGSSFVVEGGAVPLEAFKSIGVPIFPLPGAAAERGVVGLL